jgi:hypothetical protein
MAKPCTVAVAGWGVDSVGVVLRGEDGQVFQRAALFDGGVEECLAQW